MQGEPYGEQPGPRRRGRRDNGLDAERFVPLVDVDPRVGERLLEVLRMAGVPAYLEPALDVEPYTRASSTPSPPTDRLWVDRDRQEEASRIVAPETRAGVRPPTPEEHPSHGLVDPAEERAWQAIIAAFHQDLTGPAAPPWPAAEDVDKPTRRPAPPVDKARPGQQRQAEQGTGEAGQSEQGTGEAGQSETGQPEAGQPEGGRPGAEPGARQAGAELSGAERGEPSAAPRPGRAGPEPAKPAPPDDDEHFVPPPPPPMPRPSKQVVLAMALIVLGATLLLLPARLGYSQHAALALGVLALISAAGLLVFRLRDDRHDDPDDGAVL